MNFSITIQILHCTICSISVRIADLNNRVQKYLTDVSGLLKDEAAVNSIGSYLDVKQSIIQSCITDHPDSPQLAGFNVLKEWKQTITTNDLNALRSRLQHAFDNHKLVQPFLEIDID